MKYRYGKQKIEEGGRFCIPGGPAAGNARSPSRMERS
jgi:hypothetical protein